MLLYIFRKLFANIGKDQLKQLVKGNIKLKTYNGTHIMQLGTCVVQIKFKNIMKRCTFQESSRKWTGTVRDARHCGAQFD